MQGFALCTLYWVGIHSLRQASGACRSLSSRWEERSDAYWEVVEHAARAYREHGLWGAVARTNSGPEDPAWHEYPERLRRVNEEFLGSRVPNPLASARSRTEESE